MTQLPKLDSYYQPVPFSEYDPQTPWRSDCEERYRVIRDSYGSFRGKTLFDFGCAEGFFMFRFMQDGGMLARGVEINSQRLNFINQLAEAKDINVICGNDIPQMNFDIAIYLDLWGDGQDLPTIEDLAIMTRTLFVSPCRDGNEFNPRLELELDRYFSSVIPIYKGYENRAIYRCDR